jgi:hypothetical protein
MQQTRFGLSQKPRHEVERDALEDSGPFALRGACKAELIRRDREYAEGQEQSRRQFEIGLFNAESDRDTKRKQFEEALANRQMNHAAALAGKQLDAATDVAKATKWAVWAATAAALGALVQGAAAVIGLLGAK